ncbi:hypothetical protein [uncultured Methanospirillum sp.]|nr:hypothetical protein [uncultured Methanospirillum sp.]
MMTGRSIYPMVLNGLILVITVKNNPSSLQIGEYKCNEQQVTGITISSLS